MEIKGICKPRMETELISLRVCCPDRLLMIKEGRKARRQKKLMICKNITIRAVFSTVLILFLSLLSRASYGQEQQENLLTSAMVGYTVEVSATSNRDIINVGLWMAEQGSIVHAGLFGIKHKDESNRYGVDIGMGFCATGYRLWPFAEVGVKVGAGAGVTNFSAELYPKIGLAVPISYQVLIYTGYLYSFSTQGRHSDYSAASIGFVWGIM